MNDRRKREEALFDEAQGLTDLVQRKAFLDAACAADPDLRRRLEELLVDAADAEKFFEASGAALPVLAKPAEPASEQGRIGGTVRVTLLPEQQPGARIGPYKLRERIGEGGCGVVYVAEQEEPVRRRVALKVIKPGMDTKEVVAAVQALK